MTISQQKGMLYFSGLPSYGSYLEVLLGIQNNSYYVEHSSEAHYIYGYVMLTEILFI